MYPGSNEYKRAQLLAGVGEQIRLLTPDETAEFLGLSKSTLSKWRMTQSDGPPFVKLGSKVRYELGAVQAWVMARRRVSTSDVAA